jgi:hypothetical protein
MGESGTPLIDRSSSLIDGCEMVYIRSKALVALGNPCRSLREDEAGKLEDKRFT